MAINRFSRGPIAADVQSSFIPMPIDLIDRQIQRRQSSYDKAKATLGATEEALYGVKGLAQDTETLKDITSGYESSIDKAIEEAGDDYSKLTAFSDELATTVSRDMRAGHLGAIQNNFAKAQIHMEELSKNYAEGKISKEGYDLGLNSISGFGGTVEDGKGGYTKASLYTPTKYLELGKTADEYGAKIKDQYDSEGRRYINAAVATKQISNNMWNNPQVRDNVKEQILATYPNARPGTTEYNTLFSNYMTKLSKAAANKLAFQQIFKSEGIDDMTNNELTTLDSFDLIGTKPKAMRFTTAEGEDFNEIIAQAKEKGEESIFQWLEKKLPLLGSAGVGTAGVSPQGTNIKEAAKISEDIEERNLIKNHKELQKAVDEISKSDLAKDLASMAGIDLDPETITIKELQKLTDLYNTANNSSVNTRIINMNRGREQRESFNRLVEDGMVIEKPIYNYRTGKALTRTQKEALVNHINSKERDTKGSGFGYGGETVEGTAQGYAPGAHFFNSFEVDEDGGVGEGRDMYVIESPQTSIRYGDDWFTDRLNAAKSNGVVSYKYGGQNIILRTDPKDKSVLMYIDGKKITNDDYFGKGGNNPVRFK